VEAGYYGYPFIAVVLIEGVARRLFSHGRACGKPELRVFRLKWYNLCDAEK
jgi:hypothetical protein